MWLWGKGNPYPWMLVGPQSGEAFKNHDIAFLMAKNNLNVELIDPEEKQGWSGGG